MTAAFFAPVLIGFAVVLVIMAHDHRKFTKDE